MTDDVKANPFAGMFDAEKANAMMSDWMQRQKAAFETVSAKFSKSEGMGDAAALWRSYMEFWNTLSKVMPPQAGAQGSVMETLIGPAAGTTGASPLDDMIGRMSQGPNFATLWDWDRQALRVHSAGLGLKQAATAYQGVIDRAWQEAYKRFMAEFSKPAEDDKKAIKTWREGIELWFSIANQTLLEAHRSSEFLEAQRNLLRAAMDYRLQLRAVAEDLCETFQIPGRTEVDELARTVHDLRREVRALKRRLDSPETEAGRSAQAAVSAARTDAVSGPKTRANRGRNRHD
jgi:class III poly(R)-hydroxyalkanoic acid synthase PhaE subunit